MDISGVLEEVALEGLDGITISTLWLRIKKRPNFCTSALDDYTKEYIWRNLVVCTELEFYKLPKPRPDLVIKEFNDHVYQSRCLLRDFPEDIYSIERVEKDGIVGSCDSYDTRVSVMDEIKGKDGKVLLTLQQAQEKWKQELVIVASQLLRFKALFNTNFLPSEISGEAYTIVERVARSRYNGALTLPTPSGRGLVNKYSRSGNLFVVSKHLCSCGIIRKQPFNLRVSSGRNFHARLLHLTRFYKESEANFFKMLENVCNVLKDVPNWCLERQELFNKSGVLDEDFKKHWTLIQKYIKKELCAYRSVYPNAKPDEYLCKNGTERKLVVYQMIKPFSAMDIDDSDDEEDDDDGYDDEDNYVDDDDEIDEKEDIDKEVGTTPRDGNMDPQPGTGPLYELSFPRALQYIIDQAGTKGISENKLCQVLCLHKKMMNKTLDCLLHMKTVVKVPYAVGTTNAIMLMSPKAFKLRLKTAEKGPNVSAMEVDDSSSNIQVEKDADTPVTSSSSGVKVKDEDDNTIHDIDNDFDDHNLDTALAGLNLTWTLDKVDDPQPLKLETTMTEKKRDRREYILNYLRQRIVCSSMYNLRMEMRRWETDIGCKEEMCRKSFKRILFQLHKEGRICYIIIHSDKFTSGVDRKLLADINVEASDRAVKQGVLHFYYTHFKFCASMVNAGGKKMEENRGTSEEKPFSVCDALARLAEDREENIKVFQKSREKVKYPFTKEFGRTYKMAKVKLLHKFMFYLLYDYPKDVMAKEVDTESTSQDLPFQLPVYMDVNDWRRYVPPLKLHNIKFMTNIKTSGVCMIGDLLMTIPIGLFCKLITVEWKVDGLMEILNDPDKQLRPLFATPPNILRDLCHMRRYMQKFNSVMNTLCAMGLASYGPKSSLRALEHTIVCLHKQATVLDTTKSLPGHNMTRIPPPDTEFPSLHFAFNKLTDLDDYWIEIRFICMGTRLNEREPDEPGFHGEISLLDACKPRPLDDIKEDDWLPGDRRGAGGFDSSLFMHLAKKWDSKRLLPKTKKVKRPLKTVGKTPSVTEPPHKKARKLSVCTQAPNVVKKTVKKAKGSGKAKSGKGKKETSKGLPNKQRVETTKSQVAIQKTILDEINKKAKLEMDGLRCCFTPVENGLFLLCHVVSFLLCPKDLHITLPTLDIRTIFKSLVPDVSKDKTTNAIKGKSTRLIKDRNFLNHMAIYVAKARCDEELMAEYKDFHWLQSPRHRMNMFESFYSLVKKLQIKYSSKEKPLSYEWSMSVSEFHRKYNVKQAIDFAKLKDMAMPKVYLDISDSLAVRASVLWDLVLGWMHSGHSVSNFLVYSVLCHYPEEAVNKTYDILRNSRVMQTNKKYTYVSGRRVLVSGNENLVNSLVLSKKHKDNLKSSFPPELYLNVLKQLMHWEDHFNHNMTSSDGHRDDDEDDDDEDSNKTKEKTGSDDARFLSIDVRNLQGGAVLALLPLMVLDMVEADVSIPDEMLCLNEEGIRKLKFKKPQRKRKSDVLDSSIEDSNDEEDEPIGNHTRLLKRSLLKQRDHCMKTREDSTHAENNDKDAEGRDFRRQVKIGNVNLSFKCHEVHAGDILTDFSISLASGTLLALSRTHMIQDLDLINSRVNVHHFFILDPLVMRFALKCNGDVNIQTAPGGSDNTDNKDDNKSTGARKNEKLISSSTTQKQSENETISPTVSGFLSPLSCPSQSDQDLPNEKDNPNCVIKPPKPTTSHSSCLAPLVKSDLYAEILSQVEKCFPVDFGDQDVYQELDSTADNSNDWVEEGKSLFSLVDSCGPTGITEPDMECHLQKPLGTFEWIISKLRNMNAIPLQ